MALHPEDRGRIQDKPALSCPSNYECAYGWTAPYSRYTGWCNVTTPTCTNYGKHTINKWMHGRQYTRRCWFAACDKNSSCSYNWR